MYAAWPHRRECRVAVQEAGLYCATHCQSSDLECISSFAEAWSLCSSRSVFSWPSQEMPALDTEIAFEQDHVRYSWFPVYTDLPMFYVRFSQRMVLAAARDRDRRTPSGRGRKPMSATRGTKLPRPSQRRVALPEDSRRQVARVLGVSPVPQKIWDEHRIFLSARPSTSSA